MKSMKNKKDTQDTRSLMEKVHDFRFMVASINLANKLTILRILLVPVFTVFLLFDTMVVNNQNAIPYNREIALGIFILACITDWLDGYIARTRFMITDFGKFLDPIADKIIVTAALVCFVHMKWIWAWPLVVILSRDFIVSAIRLVAAESKEKLVIPARMMGKVKTAVTMITIIGILFLWVIERYGAIKYEVKISETESFYRPDLFLAPIGNAFMCICVVLTVWSGVQYVWDTRHILKDIINK